MKRIISIALSLFIIQALNAQDSLKCSGKRMYIDVSAGKGGCIGNSLSYDIYQNMDPTISNDQTHLYINSSYIINDISFINSGQISFGYSLLKKDCKIRQGVQHFIYVGAGFSNFNYQVYFKTENYSEQSHTSSYTYEFSPSDLTLKINKLNSSLFFTMGAIYPRGFYVSNSIGIGYSAYINKKETTYTEHISGSDISNSPAYITPSNPSGYYYEHTDTYNTFKLKNYSGNSLYAFYTLNLGYRIKNFIPYVSAEMNLVNGYLTSVYVFRGGLRVLL
jgi:hypothetical protein